MAALSTWGEAIVAAATGDAARMRQLLAGDLDDGLGVNLRTFRTSGHDVLFMTEARNLVIDPNYTLIEIAVERDHFDVVMALTEAPTSKPTAKLPAKPPQVARSVSTFVPRSLADQVRDFMASSFEVVADGPVAGLALLNLPPEGRSTFFLPREVMELPIEQRRLAIGMLLEDAYTMESIDETTKWWKEAVGAALGVAADSPEHALPSFGLHGLYTSGDGNCLLHATCLATLGVRDTREAEQGEPGACDAEELSRISARRTLRAALHHSLEHCVALRRLLASHGAVLQGGVAGDEPPPAGRVETLESRSRLHGNSLEPPHLLVLAHVMRRPIVCLASAAVGEVREADAGRTFSSYAAKGERMSGIYLPALLSAELTSREPIYIAYTPGHFTVLVSTEAAAEPAVWTALGLSPPAAPAAPVPLVDEDFTPLPVLFAPPPADASVAAADHEQLLCETYMRIYTASIAPTPAAGEAAGNDQPKTLPISAQSVPKRHTSTVDARHVGPADEYYETVWARRAEAAKQPIDDASYDGNAPSGRMSSRSSFDLQHEDSETQLAAAIAASLEQQ